MGRLESAVSLYLPHFVSYGTTRCEVEGDQDFVFGAAPSHLKGLRLVEHQ